MKATPETSEEYDRFTELVDRMLAVSPADLKKAEQERKAPKPKKS